MALPYPEPNTTTIGFMKILGYTNSVLATDTSNSIFTMAICLLVFTISIIFLLKNNSPSTALTATGFISFIISMLFYYAGVLDGLLPMSFGACVGAGLFFMYLEHNKP